MGIFNFFNKGNLKEYLANGAQVIDVRMPGEFQSGHVDGAKNIPLQAIAGRVEEIKKLGKPIIVCCASGMRSGDATSILKNQGVDCVNGGSWRKVEKLRSGV